MVGKKKKEILGGQAAGGPAEGESGEEDRRGSWRSPNLGRTS